MKNLWSDMPAGVLIALLAVLTLTLRGFMPYDETRYIAVAWEMWQSHDWLIPTINGNVYADKPPLLFWLVNLGWHLSGVNAWWPRSLPLIFALLNIFLARQIACNLWPERAGLRQAVPLMLMSVPVWFAYTTPFMFDMAQTFFVLSAVLGLTMYRENNFIGFIMFGVATGLGMLLKGPVIFAYVLPLAVTIPFWHEHYAPEHRFFLWKGISIGLLIGFGIFATWLVPVIQTLGVEQVRALFLHQTADRMLHGSAHARPIWWYLPFLPLMFFPWVCKVSFWKSFHTGQDRTERKKRLFLLLWIIPSFIFLAAINAKQLHYLLPLLPPLVIGMAVLLTDQRNGVNPMDNNIAGFMLILSGLVFYLYRALTHHAHNAWIDQISPLFPVIAIIAGLLVICIKSEDQYHSIKILAFGTLVILYTAYTALLTAPRPFAGIDAFSQMLATLQKNNVPLAHLGSHREQFTFPGRLTRPLDKVTSTGIRQWAAAHPDGYVITLLDKSDLQKKINTVYSQPYRFRQNLVLITSQDILNGTYAFKSSTE